MDRLFGHFQEGLRQHPFAFVGKTLVVALGLALTYLVCLSAYNVFFHPLRHFPGPKLWAMSRIPYTRNSISGRPQRKMLDLHQTYGPFVRVAPEIIAISHPNAAKDLRGHRKGGEAEHGKDPINMYQFRSSILGANREDHTRFRRVMSHGFSAQAMMEQQSTIKSYVDLLFKRLHEKCAKDMQPLDMVRWYNWTTFDIIGDLAFGEPFDCLENASYHPWVSLIFESIKNLSFWSNASRYQSIAPLLRRFLIPRSLASKLQEHNQLAEMKVRKRLATETDRPDFIGKMVQGSKNKGGDLTFAELSANASVLIIAGSETTATLLSGATFLLAKNLRTLATLTEEVRSTFTSEDEIDLVSTQHLTYLQAVLDESLRFYPPAPSGQPRKIAAGGDEIAGRFVPEGTIVETWQWALYHNPSYFTLPDEFIPERWLGDKRFVNDQRDAVQPFSVGPRNCIGRNLAYAEMRIILARMIWNFDLKLADQSKDWYEQNSLFTLWEKGPLYVYLTPRHKI